MADSSIFNLNELVDACYIGTTNSRDMKLQAIKVLEGKYSDEQLTIAYIHFFDLESDFEIQKYLIKLIDKIKHPKSFDFFINMELEMINSKHRQ